MIKEAIEKILELKTTITQVGGETYADRNMLVVRKPPTPVPTALSVISLAGLLALISERFESISDNILIHVAAYNSVNVIANQSDEFGRRQTYIAASPLKVAAFLFEQYLGHEAFIIGLQACFEPTEDRNYLLRIAGSLTAEHIAVSEDDGVTQLATLKRGVALKNDPAPLRSRVTLAPFRTFREVPQPTSEFIFRVHQDKDEFPTLGLFAADGGKWQLDAMEAIGVFLRRNQNEPGIPVIPVIV